ILKEVFEELELAQDVKFFDSSLAVLEYLLNACAQPVLIISDINLPQMTGIELKEKINQSETLRNRCIPFVFLTTTGDQAVINKAFKMVPQGYFVKPTTMHGIRETILMILQYWNISKRPDLSLS